MQKSVMTFIGSFFSVIPAKQIALQIFGLMQFLVRRGWKVALVLVLFYFVLIPLNSANGAVGSQHQTYMGERPDVSELTSTSVAAPPQDSILAASRDGAKWQPTGSMNTARAFHSLTTLKDGKVLVTGGDDAYPNGGPSHIETYDPATGLFTSTGTPLVARSFHTATLLPSGKVLLAGGSSNNPMNNAEVYDPVSHTSTLTSYMTAKRAFHTATLLPTGKVLLVGGGTYSTFLSSAELFDPATASFTPTVGTLATARWSHTATLLPDGRVVIIGGSRSSTAVEIYNPATDSFTPAGQLNQVRLAHTATLLPNGKILVVGGNDGVNYAIFGLASAEIYDPVTHNATFTPPLGTIRSFHTANLLLDGRVLVTTGQDDTAEIYDSALNGGQGGWYLTARLSTNRSEATGITLASGKVLVTGGAVEYSSNYVATAELYDPATSDWKTVGSLNGPRADHTSTLLQNGTVLLAGGESSGVNELYDPATGSFTTTTPLVTARRNHTATVLTTGKVLIAGGRPVVGNNPAALNSTELYDPVTKIVSSTGNLGVARTNHVALRLRSGKVLIAGGQTAVGQVLNSVELYDPVVGTFAPSPDLNQGRTDFAAALLNDGRVIVVGGKNAGGAALASAEIYDPSSTAPGSGWTLVSSNMTTPRTLHSLTLLASGQLLIVGGKQGSLFLSSAELFDPATGSFTPVGALGVARAAHTATLLPSGKVLITGGLSQNGPTPVVELYDSVEASFTPGSPLDQGREGQRAVLLASGQVLLTGGRNSGGTLLAPARLYDYALAASGSVSNFFLAHYDHTSLLLSDGNILLIGGATYGQTYTPIAVTDLYNTISNTWQRVGDMHQARYLAAVSLLADGRVLAAGGCCGSEKSAEVYDPLSKSWTVTGDLNSARSGAAAVLLANGKVLVLGGSDNSAELYDPASGTFSVTGSLAFPRQRPSATRLPKGKVLVAGGGTNSTELYDPTTGTFSPTASMNIGRGFNTATLLPNGRVLVVGGSNLAEVYDPLSATWSLTEPMLAFHDAHTATLLPTGKVLVTGGYYGYRSSSELYDPATGHWAPASNLADTRRVSHAATLLPTGKILITGGRTWWNSISDSSELFDVGLLAPVEAQPHLATATQSGPGQPLVLTGTGFEGISEASGGTNGASPTNYGQLQLVSLVNNQIGWYGATGWSSSVYTSTPIINFTPGWAVARIFVNGVGSNPLMVNLDACSYQIVTQVIDDGQGLGCGTLSYALKQASLSSSDVTITLPARLTITGPMPVVSSSLGITITLEGGCQSDTGPSQRGVPGSELTAGEGAGDKGLVLLNNAVVEGVKITGFRGDGLVLTGDHNRVKCSWIGTANGTDPAGNGGGVRVNGTDNWLGLDGEPLSGNLIWSNQSSGLIIGGSAKKTCLAYTWLGLNRAGRAGSTKTGFVPLQIQAGGQLLIQRGNRIAG